MTSLAPQLFGTTGVSSATGSGKLAAAFISWKSGGWYGGPFQSTPRQYTGGVLHFLFWMLPVAFPVSQLRYDVNNTTLPATTTHHLSAAWFNDGGHWNPHNKVVTFGTQVFKKRAVTVGYRFFTFTVTIPAGPGWLCTLLSGATIAHNTIHPIAAISTSSLNIPGQWWLPASGVQATTPATTLIGWLSKASTFVTIPATAPVVATLTAKSTSATFPAGRFRAT